MSRNPAIASGLGVVLMLIATAIAAGGSNYGSRPGGMATFAGQIREWPVPTPEFARDPAVAPDGSIFIAVMNGNKVARFDPATENFREWQMPPRHRPHGLLVDGRGIVWTTGHGNGTIGRLDPASGRIDEFKTPSGGGGPHTLVISDDGTALWFTLQSGDRIGRLDVASGRITEYRTAGGPYGIALDREGRVWFCRIDDDRLGILDPQTGRIDEVVLPRGSRPRRMATAPDGTLWVTLYGSGKLIQVDTAARRVAKEVAMPGGAIGGPYAVTVDAAGVVWSNELHANTVLRFDPARDKLENLTLPTANSGIRKMVVDAAGRLWYVGSHSGRLGMIR
ncbi:MAG: hypothetical protein HZC24_10675 [Rhodocyclales bacterium]|nr:hypothetical protein [Rhodocyclales bacterium]